VDETSLTPKKPTPTTNATQAAGDSRVTFKTLIMAGAAKVYKDKGSGGEGSKEGSDS